MEKYAKQICKNKQIFRGVFLRDTVPLKPCKIEIGILNIDSITNQGTHWTFCIKK